MSTTLTASVGTATLAPEIDRTMERLARVAPAAAERARDALADVLRPIRESPWPEVAHRYSRLTNTGFPVEFAWTSRDTSVRWTAEVAGPEEPEHTRLQLVAEQARLSGLVGQLGLWQTIQQQGDLQYGAWLGARHHADSDAFKIYLELPGGLPSRPPVSHPVLRWPALSWRMAGLYPDGSCELYGRSTELGEVELDSIEHSTLGSTSRLVTAARALLGGLELPRHGGVSVTLRGDGRPLALTWFTPAKSHFRDDVAARTAIHRRLSQLEAAPGSADLYAALASGPPDGRWRHSLIGVGVAVDGSSWLQAGIRPT